MIEIIKEFAKAISRTLILALICVVVLQHCNNKQLKQENKRLENNYNALTNDVKTYRLKDSSAVAETETLLLTKQEFENRYKETKQKIKDLKIKINKLRSYQTTNIITDYKIDTIRLIDTIVRDSLKCFEYTDNWVEFSGCLDREYLINSQITTFDTINTYLSKQYRKRFLFFKWKPYYKVTLHSKNPYSKITSAEYVEIKR